MNPPPPPVPEPMVEDTATPASAPKRPRLATLDDVRVGALLYMCFGGAPTLDLEWTSSFPPMRSSDLIDAGEMLQFQLNHQVLATHPPFLSQFVVKAVEARTDGVEATDSVDPPLDLDGKSLLQECANVWTRIRTAWNDHLCTCLTTLVADRAQATNMDPAQFRIAMPLTKSNKQSYAQLLDKYRIWSATQCNALSFALWAAHHPPDMASWKSLGTRETSPNVFLFLCMFDAIDVQDRTTLRGRYRLNATGKSILGQLWVHLLNKLPPFFFVECAWLDDQTGPPIRLPILGVAHVLSTVMLWQSRLVLELTADGVNDVIAHSVKMLKPLLHVDGHRVSELSSGDSAHKKMVVMDDSEHIDLELPDLQWIHLMGIGLDFFSVIRQLHPHPPPPPQQEQRDEKPQIEELTG